MLAQLGRAPIARSAGCGLHRPGNRAPRAPRARRKRGGETQRAPYAHALELFEAAYLEHVADRSRPYPGVVAGLERLRRAGIALGCVTNKASRFTLPLLAATGLRTYFGAIVSGDDVARKKPEPDALLAAAATLGVMPRECWLIGDSANDVKAARAAGCAVAVVPYGYREGLSVEALGADAVVAER